MPDKDGEQKIAEEELPATPLHAYKEGREEDLEGGDDPAMHGEPPENSPKRDGDATGQTHRGDAPA